MILWPLLVTAIAQISTSLLQIQHNKQQADWLIFLDMWNFNRKQMLC